MGREGPEGAGDTHITQIQKLSLAGQAEEGGADDQMNLQEGARLSAWTVGVYPALHTLNTYLQGGQQGGQVGKLFLEGFVLFFILAGGRAG